MLYKLTCLGVSGPLLNVITSFLADRSQKVSIQGALSVSANIISGVPQGSVLGPILFVIYINDLSDIFPKTVTSKYFADDAKLYTEINSADDIDNLQFSLDKISDWASNWQLSIAIKKCYTMDMSVKAKIGFFCNNSIDGVEIENVSSLRDLGVFAG